MDSNEIREGQYVLATKYEDGDPGDQWAVGFFHSMLPKLGGDRYMVVDNDDQQFRGNGFRRCEPITGNQGEWLVMMIPEIQKDEASPFYDEDGDKIGKSLWDWLQEAPL